MASAPTSTDILPGIDITTSGIPTGVVIAIAIVVVLFIAGGIGLLIFFCCRRRRLRRNMEPYRPSGPYPYANPSATPLMEMQQTGFAGNPPPNVPRLSISRPPSLPQPRINKKYDSTQLHQEVFEAPGNDEHPPDLAFAQQVIHGSLFPEKDKLEPKVQIFSPVSPISTPATPALSMVTPHMTPVSPLLTASSPPPPANPGRFQQPPPMIPISPFNTGSTSPPRRPGQQRYFEPPVGIVEAPDTSVPRPLAELG